MTTDIGKIAVITEQLCQRCGKVFLEKDEKGFFCTSCGDYIEREVEKKEGQKNICPICGEALRFDFLLQSFTCRTCHIEWGISSIIGCAVNTTAGRMIGC